MLEHKKTKDIIIHYDINNITDNVYEIYRTSRKLSHINIICVTEISEKSGKRWVIEILTSPEKKSTLYANIKDKIMKLFNVLHYNILIHHTNLVFVGKGTIHILHQLFDDVRCVKDRYLESIKHDKMLNTLFKNKARELIDTITFN